MTIGCGCQLCYERYMKDTDQIAAEAWQKIQYYYTPDMTGHTGRTGEAIIKSAIKKAHSIGYVDGYVDGRNAERACYDRAAHASEHKAGCPALGGYGHGEEECICRAAHASEHPHANWCQSLPPFNANCNCGAAHASEVTKEKE